MNAGVYYDLSDKMMKNPSSVSENDIRTAELEPKQKETLIKFRKEQIDDSSGPDAIYRSQYKSAINTLIKDKMFSGNDTKNLHTGTRILAAFDQFSLEPHTNDEYQAFYDGLIDQSIDMPDHWDWMSSDTYETRYWAEQRADELERKYMPKTTPQTGTGNQDTTTFEGKVYKVDDTMEINGQLYRYTGNDNWEPVQKPSPAKSGQYARYPLI